jgi:hypothetical protein
MAAVAAETSEADEADDDAPSLIRLRVEKQAAQWAHVVVRAKRAGTVEADSRLLLLLLPLSATVLRRRTPLVSEVSRAARVHAAVAAAG